MCVSTPCSCHSFKRLWQVESLPYRSGMSFQGAPVRITQRMPLTRHFGCRGRVCASARACLQVELPELICPPLQPRTRKSPPR